MDAFELIRDPPFSVVGHRRGRIAAALGFVVTAHGRVSNDGNDYDVWRIPRVVNELMELVEDAINVQHDGDAGEAREQAIVREFDVRPELVAAINATGRVGGHAAVLEFIRGVDLEIRTR